MENVLFYLLGIPALLVLPDFLYYLMTGKRLYPGFLQKTLNIVCIIAYPLLFLGTYDKNVNDCCALFSAFFSPDHRLSIYALIVLCMLAFFMSVSRKDRGSPVFEVLLNVFLLIGIVLNVLIAIQITVDIVWAFGTPSIVMLFALQLIDNHRFIVQLYKNHEPEHKTRLQHFSWRLLQYKPLLKYPLLTLVCLPVLTVFDAILLLFAQKPDSLIRAFTDTYFHGFSQWNYMCDNVHCGGHFLCSVAAQGHAQIVQPERLGIRNGAPIICNRQLLIANAFEELVEQKMPRLHRVIRRNYNKVGDMIHRHYHVFNNKYVADFVYVMMKPLEWCFLLVLYTFDAKPENRIAQQYLRWEDRAGIQAGLEH